MDSTYNGRLMCDGETGHLLADESKRIGEASVAVHDDSGEPVIGPDGVTQLVVVVPIVKYGQNHGRPVLFEDGIHRFLEEGEASHNERYETGKVVVVATQVDNPDLPGFAGTKDKPTEGNEHHWGATPDDPHFEEGAGPWNTRVKSAPDRFSRIRTGHTESTRNA